MPNNCMNYLNVKGKYVDILKFIKGTHSVGTEYEMPRYRLSFENIKATPIKENGEIIEEWYDWRIKNWDTKWDLYDEFGHITVGNIIIDTHDKKFNFKHLDEICQNKEVEAEYQLGFCTAWSPAMSIYEKLAEDYNDLDLTFKVQYDEGGCAFAGHIKFNKGEIIEDVYVDVCKDPINYYEYLLENEIEDIDYLLENMFSSVEEDYENETDEFRTKLFNKLQEVMKSEKANNRGRAKLYVDVCLKAKENIKAIEGDK